MQERLSQDILIEAAAEGFSKKQILKKELFI